MNSQPLKHLMSIFFAATALTMGGGIYAPSIAQAAEIIVYADAFYSGGSRRFTSDVRNLSDERFNDRISSMRVVSGTWTVCTDANFSGRCERVTGDVSNLASTGLNDRITSIYLEGRGHGHDAIIIFNSTRYGGRNVRLDEDTPRLGAYDFNDRASSVRVEGGTWELCRDGDYRGRCITVSEDVPFLGVLGMNNDISSVRRIHGHRDEHDYTPEHVPESHHDLTIFEHTDFRGRALDVTDDMLNLSSFGFNDLLSSFRIHEGRWEFCEHSNYAGRCWTFDASESNVVPQGLNDRISSLRRVPPESIFHHGISVFEHSGYGGRELNFTGDIPRLSSFAFNDMLSSFRIHDGRWELCEHAHYAGRCWIFDADESNVGRLGINDRISSIRYIP